MFRAPPLFALGFFVWLVWLATPARSAESASRPLDRLFQLNPLWGATREVFMAHTQGLEFRWVSEAKEAARAAGPGLIFAGQPVVESLVRFNATGLHGLTFQFYNRGDAGDLTEAAFQERVAQCQAILQQGLGGQPGTPRPKGASVAVDSEAVSWQFAGGEFLLEWSWQKPVRSRDVPFRAEFIRLTAAPVVAVPETFTLTQGIERATTGADPLANIRRDPNGDVHLDNLPMVDQGQKGYCVTASVERVLRYFGAAIDQHEIAQLANSDAQRGTSSSDMLDAMKAISNRTGVRVREHYAFDYHALADLLKDYNRAAKKADAPEVFLPQGGMIDLTAIYSRMKPGPLREARAKEKSKYGRFVREIETQIDRGIPVVWSVMLGLMPEEPALPQSFGGHMRLIYGYNKATNELLYTDSWGRGHEAKRMKFEDAWAITTGLSTLEPF